MKAAHRMKTIRADRISSMKPEARGLEGWRKE
jgi:hypothetical protein